MVSLLVSLPRVPITKTNPYLGVILNSGPKSLSESLFLPLLVLLILCFVSERTCAISLCSCSSWISLRWTIKNGVAYCMPKLASDVFDVQGLDILWPYYALNSPLKDLAYFGSIFVFFWLSLLPLQGANRAIILRVSDPSRVSHDSLWVPCFG